jgi:hypothetical protein
MAPTQNLDLNMSLLGISDHTNRMNNGPVFSPDLDSTATPEAEEWQEGNEKNSLIVTENPKSIFILVDDDARERLADVVVSKGKKEIKKWLGHLPSAIRNSYDIKQISIRDARIINEKTGKKILTIDRDRIDKFIADDEILNRIHQLFDSKEISSKNYKEIGLSKQEFSNLRDEKGKTILKTTADKINEYFKKNPTKTFITEDEIIDLDGILQKALTEPLDNLKKSSPNVWVKIQRDHREELKQLNKTIQKKLKEAIGANRYTHFTTSQTRFLQIKDAMLIDRISNKEIFSTDFTTGTHANVYCQFTSKELSLFTKEVKKINESTEYQKILHSLKHSGRKRIQIDQAKNINLFFKQIVFNLESPLSEAIREAEAEIKKRYCVSSYSSWVPQSQLQMPVDLSSTWLPIQAWHITSIEDLIGQSLPNITGIEFLLYQMKHGYQTTIHIDIANKINEHFNQIVFDTAAIQEAAQASDTTKKRPFSDCHASQDSPPAKRQKVDEFNVEQNSSFLPYDTHTSPSATPLIEECSPADSSTNDEGNDYNREHWNDFLT